MRRKCFSWLDSNKYDSEFILRGVINPFYSNVPFLYPLETSEKHNFLTFSGGIKWKNGLKWVKILLLTVNIFRRKTRSDIFDNILNTSLSLGLPLQRLEWLILWFQGTEAYLERSRTSTMTFFFPQKSSIVDIRLNTLLKEVFRTLSNIYDETFVEIWF